MRSASVDCVEGTAPTQGRTSVERPWHARPLRQLCTRRVVTIGEVRARGTRLRTWLVTHRLIALVGGLLLVSIVMMTALGARK
jgi:hypothetical protein